MKSADAHKAMASGQGSTGRKPYAAPGFKRLSPEAARGLLLEHGDMSDPGVKQLLDRIDQLQANKVPDAQHESSLANRLAGPR